MIDLSNLAPSDYPTYRKADYHLILEWPNSIKWPSLNEKTDGIVSSTRIEKDFHERRAGLTWMTPHNDAYFCILGVLDIRLATPSGRRPVELLHETRTRSRANLFRRIASAMQVCACEWLVCDCSTKFDVLYHDLMRFCNVNHIDYFRAFDIADETGYLQAMSAVDDLMDFHFLRIDRAHIDDIVTIRGGKNPYLMKPMSQLKIEMANLTPDDLHSIDHTQPEQRFPAVAALNHVITSLELYPWHKPDRKDETPPKWEGYG